MKTIGTNEQWSQRCIMLLLCSAKCWSMTENSTGTAQQQRHGNDVMGEFGSACAVLDRAHLRLHSASLLALTTLVWQHKTFASSLATHSAEERRNALECVDNHQHPPKMQLWSRGPDFVSFVRFGLTTHVKWLFEGKRLPNFDHELTIFGCCTFFLFGNSCCFCLLNSR